MKRHLIMHVYPLACHQNWRRAVAHVRARAAQFDGRRIVAVAYDVATCSPDEVRDAFGPCDVELFGVRNSRLQEVETFARQLAMIRDEPGITFRCHAKGATHCDPDSGSHPWCDMMFEACLDYPRLIDTVLAEVPVCGPFRSQMLMGSVEDSPPWHFAGSFYWFRNDALFARDWRTIDPVLWGTESYPGKRFRWTESACLFFDAAHTAHLYSAEFWREAIGPVQATWRQSLAAAGLAPLIPPGFSPPCHGPRFQNPTGFGRILPEFGPQSNSFSSASTSASVRGS